MQVFNVRLGLATNSSSSHSIIILKDGIEAFDFPVAEHSGEYGWGNFTCASAETKMKYLGVLLRDRFYHELPENIADIICKDWLDGIQPGQYVDHQSWYFLPSAFNTKLPDEQFFRALKEYFLHEKLVILGGNDNQEAIHPLDDGTSFELPLPLDVGHWRKFTCRYDDQHDYWTVFCAEDGRKIRFRLKPGSKDFNDVPTKASAPELVDMKITNYCPFGCKFCYQSSTAEGRHAEEWDIYRMAMALGVLKVFEVALGGGEPTMHPEFIEILETFRENGIVPNFTTRNHHWLRDPTKWPKIMELCGAFAFSVDNFEDIKKLSGLLDYNGIDHDRCNLHVVMGTINKWAFQKLLRTASDYNFKVTLLGYKRVGFGETFRPEGYEWWLQEVMELVNTRNCPTLSIDTVLAAESQNALEEAGVPKWLYTVEEGKFSCYIDMVGQRIGPSSYCPPHEMINFEELSGGQPTYQYNELEMLRDAFQYF